MTVTSTPGSGCPPADTTLPTTTTRSDPWAIAVADRKHVAANAGYANTVSRITPPCPGVPERVIATVGWHLGQQIAGPPPRSRIKMAPDQPVPGRPPDPSA